MSLLCAKLHNGVYMPAVQLGTWLLTSDQETAVDAVKASLKCGYQSIDTAWVYKNADILPKIVNDYDGISTYETPIECASFKNIPIDKFIQNFYVPHANTYDKNRKIFLTSKIWIDAFKPGSVRKQLEEILNDYKRESMDLILLHFPGYWNKYNIDEATRKRVNCDKTRFETWQELEELYAEGKIRAIGVSNYMYKHLKPLIDNIEERKRNGSKTAVIPMVNQFAIAAQLQPKKDIKELCDKYNIIITSHSTLGGENKIKELLAEPIVQKIAKNKNCSSALIYLRWALQSNYTICPKSVKVPRVIENIKVLTISLTDSEMKQLNELKQQTFDVFNKPDPYTID